MFGDFYDFNLQLTEHFLYKGRISVSIVIPPHLSNWTVKWQVLLLDFVKNSPETLKGMKTPVAELGVKVGGGESVL